MGGGPAGPLALPGHSRGSVLHQGLLEPEGVGVEGIPPEGLLDQGAGLVLSSCPEFQVGPRVVSADEFVDGAGAVPPLDSLRILADPVQELLSLRLSALHEVQVCQGEEGGEVGRVLAEDLLEGCFGLWEPPLLPPEFAQGVEGESVGGVKPEGFPKLKLCLGGLMRLQGRPAGEEPTQGDPGGEVGLPFQDLPELGFGPAVPVYGLLVLPFLGRPVPPLGRG